MKAKKCTLYMNSPATGYRAEPIECESINEALRIARMRGWPYDIYIGKKLIKRGWMPSKW